MSIAFKKRLISYILTFISGLFPFVLEYLTSILSTLEPWTEKAIIYTVIIVAIRAIIKEFIPDSYK